MQGWRRLAVYGLVLVPLGVTVHEAGHGLTALAIGLPIAEVGVFPGIVLYPEFAWRGWGPLVGWVGVAGQPGQLADGAIAFAGAGATWLVALAAALVLLVGPPRVARSAFVRALSLYHLDGLTYTFLPQVGLRHWVVIGGATAEPLEGARACGIHAWVVMAFAVATTWICLQAFVRSLRVDR